MASKLSKCVDASSSLRDFGAIPDAQLVTEMLEDRTRRDACPGFSAFVAAATKRKLDGRDAERFIDAGLTPKVYLAIRWWCLLCIPLVPLGAYAVADYNSVDRPFSDPHSRAFPVAMDWPAALLQAALGLVAVAMTIAIGLWVSGF